MDNKLNYQVLIMQAVVVTNNKVIDEPKKDNDEFNKKLKKLQWLRQDKDIYQTSACSELNLFSILDLFNKVPVS